MTAGDGNLLLLAGAHSAEELKASLPADALTLRGEPYQALEELARRKYQAVVMTFPQADFAALVRAVRRLQPEARTFALCSPAGEADLRMAPVEGLDDYFIYPPSPEDIQQILRAGPAKPPAPAPEAAGLSAEEVAALVDSASSLETLADRVRQIVGRWTGLETRWAGADEPPQTGQQLLLLDADPPRVLVSSSADEVPPGERRRLGALQVLLGPLAAQARRTEALHHLAITDHLTGAHNRRYFYHFTDRLLQRARVEHSRATLLLFDIDDFKGYNDTYGHAVGDEILRETTGLLRQVTRRHDVIARIGGDEFAVLFWDAEPPRRPDSRHPQSPYEVAGRFVEALRRHEFASLGPKAKGVLTISGGLATYPWDGQSCRELLRHADIALHEAKKSGKNAIYLVGEGRLDDSGRA